MGGDPGLGYGASTQVVGLIAVEREAMKRKDLDYVVIAAMLASGSYTALTGLLMDLLDLPLLAGHAGAGYACAALGGLHLLLNRKKVRGFLRHRVGKSTRIKEQTPGVFSAWRLL